MGSPAERLVLAAYAYRAGAKLVAWPGLETLAADTALYRETITAARRELVKVGHLIDTGQRRGHFGRVAVFRLNFNERQKPHLPADQSAAKAAHCGDEMSGKSRTDERQKPQTDTPEKPHGTCQLNSPLNSSGETAQGAEAPEPEQPKSAALMRGTAAELDAFADEHDGQAFEHEDGRRFEVSRDPSGVHVVYTMGHGAAPLTLDFVEAIRAGRIARAPDA